MVFLYVSPVRFELITISPCSAKNCLNFIKKHHSA